MTKLTFTQILESEHRHLVEAIEWGSSDPEIIAWLVKELEIKTGYKYITH